MSNTPAKVYVVHQPVRKDRDTNLWVPSLDISDASRFGEIVFMLSSRRRPLFNDPTEWLPILRERMMDFQPHDYLLMVGDMHLVGCALSLAARRVGGMVNVLKWDAIKQEYDCLPTELWKKVAA